MEPFRYEAPATLEETCKLLSGPGGARRPMAGGTDLLVQAERMASPPEAIIDLKRIPDLNAIAWEDDGVRIGAAVTCARLRDDPAIGERYPALTDAVALIGGAAIQNRATLGGNVCNAAPSADSIPALMVHCATCLVVGAEGPREIPVAEFFSGPGRTVLQPGEIVAAFRLPADGARESSSYLRFTSRGEMDIAVVGAAAWLQLGTDGRITDARVALAAVAPTPLDVPAVGETLIGQSPGVEAFGKAAEVAMEACRPITDHRGTREQRRHLVGVLTRRALETVLNRIQSAHGEPS